MKISTLFPQRMTALVLSDRRPSWVLASFTVAILIAATLGVRPAYASLIQTGASVQSGSSANAVAGHFASNARRQEKIQQKQIDNPEADEGANVYRHAPNVRATAKLLGLPLEFTSRLFEIINFIVLVIGIVWLVGRILPKALRARSARIQAELLEARSATEEAKRRLALVEERLARLDGEIEAIRKQAEQETLLEEQRLRDALEKEKQSILASASQDIASAAKNAENQLKRLTADLVIQHAQRRLHMTPDTDRSLMRDFLSDLGDGRGNGSRGGVN